LVGKIHLTQAHSLPPDTCLGCGLCVCGIGRFPLNNRLIIGIGLIFFLFPLIALGVSAEPETVYSKGLAQIKLLVPADAQVRGYLGLAQESGQFSLSEVKADILIIEIFNMYCPFCQRHAPMANRLFQTIQGRDDLKERVKFIGLGITNSAYEVNIFREKYSVKFPLFEDKAWSIVNALPGIRTPHYFGLRKNGNSMELFLSKQGSFDNEGEFLGDILKDSGIQF
jgi:AhpC/TSA family